MSEFKSDPRTEAQSDPQSDPETGSPSDTQASAAPSSREREAVPETSLVEGPLRIDLSRVPAPSPLPEKFLRLLWACFQIPFLPIMPRALSPLRVALLRLFGAKIGPGCLIDAGVKVWMPWKLTMGKLSSIGVNTEVYNFAPVTIGRHVVVSQYNYLCTATHDYTDPFFRLTASPIHIGSQSWVASGCLLAPGITIGEGAVIGARSVVTRSMPAWTICAGSPCKPLKPRVVRAMPARPMPAAAATPSH